MNTIAECKSRLPLPALLVKLGYGEPNRNGFIPSPFRPGESGDSFHVFRDQGLWFYRDHATSEKGGDEITLLEKLRGITNKQAIELYHELAGVEWRKAPASIAQKNSDSVAGIGKPVATYAYLRADGSPAFEVCRYQKGTGGKTFRQRRRSRQGERSSNGFVWRVEESERVLYRLPELIACAPDQPVFLVEGEKDADRLAGLGLVATCNAGGAGKWQATYTASLAGKWVVLIGDNDEPGRKHVAQVAELLRPVTARLGIIDLAVQWPECPAKGDVSDWLDAMAKRSSSPPNLGAMLRSWAEAAPNRLASVSVSERDEKKPWIQLPGANWQLSQCAAELGAALRDHPFFTRSGLAVWPNHAGSGLEEIAPRSFASRCERHVTMWNFTGHPRAKCALSMTNEDAGRILASAEFLHQLREVERISPVRMPALRASGAIELLQDGYDAESKTLTLAGLDYPMGMSFHDAWEVISDLLKEFPFAKEPTDDLGEHLSFDRNLAVAVAAMVSVYARGLLAVDALAPAFLYVANTEGAGKTLLASLALVPVFGAVNTRPQPKDEEKFKQELLSIAMSGKSYVLFDNWRGQVASSSLEAFITSTHWEGRRMRENLDWCGRKEATVFITGNNCTTNGDMRRRSLMCDLFVEEARSEDRKIAKRMDISAIQARRPEILAALWALVKHWDAEGRPSCSREHGSFAAWARVIGGIVECARFGCCVGESRSMRSGDLYLQQMTQLCEAVFDRGTSDAISSTPSATGVATRVATPLKRGLSYEEVVGVAQDRSLFEELLEFDKDGELDRKARSAFARMLKRYDCRVFKGTIRMSATGAGHGRKYVFERLGGG